MDFAKLKDIAKRLGGILVMDGNSPDFVIMSYERFEQIENTNMMEIPSEEEQMIDALNKEILALKEEIRQKEMTEAETV